MGLREQISEDMKTAMKARNRRETSVLRMLLSEMKYAQAANSMDVELTDDEQAKVVATYQKRLKKSLDEYPEGEQRDEILGEIEIVARYLPAVPDEAEVRSVVKALIAESETPNFGSLMKASLAKLGPGAEGKLVSQILKEELQSVTPS